MKKKYYRSSVWSYEKDTADVDDGGAVYDVYYKDEYIGTAPCWSIMQEGIKESKKYMDDENRIERFQSYIYQY